MEQQYELCSYSKPCQRFSKCNNRWYNNDHIFNRQLQHIHTGKAVNPAATAITGTLTVCAGLTTQLSDGIGGGTWSSSDGSLATVGLSTGLVTGVANGTPVITYTLPTGCTTTTVVTGKHITCSNKRQYDDMCRPYQSVN